MGFGLGVAHLEGCGWSKFSDEILQEKVCVCARKDIADGASVSLYGRLKIGQSKHTLLPCEKQLKAIVSSLVSKCASWRGHYA